MKKFAVVIIAIMTLTTAGCSPSFDLFKDASDPLEEHVLTGTGMDKVAMITVRGFISDAPKSDLLTSSPSVVQETVSQLRLAEEDDNVKAVVLKIDSPGGTTTASDILYHEINEFKTRSGKKVIAVFMDVAASGGYYIALPADYIIAHPTSVTGSVGVILVQPALSGIMEKVGVDITVTKSGRNKDMGSPFREATEEEQQLMQSVIADLGDQFAGHVAHHRNLDAKAMEEVKTARIFVASAAKDLGLIDDIGYLPDALKKTKEMVGLDEDAKVIVYRRTKYHNDTVYNVTTSSRGPNVSLVSLNLPPSLASLSPGFYYLWTPAVR